MLPKGFICYYSAVIYFCFDNQSMKAKITILFILTKVYIVGVSENIITNL